MPWMRVTRPEELQRTQAMEAEGTRLRPELDEIEGTGQRHRLPAVWD